MNRRVRAGLRLAGIGALALLYGSAYGAVGVYIAMFVDALAVAEHWPVVWLLVWVAFGSVVLTVWTIRWTGIGAAWFRPTVGSYPQRTDTVRRQGATP